MLRAVHAAGIRPTRRSFQRHNATLYMQRIKSVLDVCLRMRVQAVQAERRRICNGMMRLKDRFKVYVRACACVLVCVCTVVIFGTSAEAQAHSESGR